MNLHRKMSFRAQLFGGKDAQGAPLFSRTLVCREKFKEIVPPICTAGGSIGAMPIEGFVRD